MQRRIGTAVIAITIVVVLGGCWAQPGSDAERSGYSPLDHGITPANVAQLHVTWTKTLPGPVNEPAVTDAGVFATSGAYPSAGVVTSLARDTGATQWRTALFDADSGFSSGPPVERGNTVFVPTPGISPILGRPIDVFDAGTGAQLPTAGSGGDEGVRHVVVVLAVERKADVARDMVDVRDPDREGHDSGDRHARPEPSRPGRAAVVVLHPPVPVQS